MALNPEIQQKAKSAFEQKCFTLIIEAYKTSLSKKTIQLNWNENDISSEIHEYLKANDLRKMWRVSTNVEAHIPKLTKKTKGFSSEFPRIDFRLTTFSKGEEYEYFFEAKNLKQNDSALKRRYIDTGINNFVSKKYENGSLVAYILEGNSDSIIEGVNSLLIKDKRHSEILKTITHKLLSPYCESSHTNLTILKHLFFDFTVINKQND